MSWRNSGSGREVQLVVTGMAQQGILVTAIHNHWLFDQPKLIYIHIEAVMNPVDFASRVARVLSFLK